MVQQTEAEQKRDDGSENQPFRRPKLELIADLIRPNGPIQAGEEKAQKGAADNAKHYTRIEKELGGNKMGAGMARRLVKMSDETRHDVLRTLLPLIDMLKLAPPRDLVDEAQGEEFVTDGRKGAGFGYKAPDKTDAPQTDGDDEGDESSDDDAGDETEGEEPEPVAGKAKSNVTPLAEAMKRSRARLAPKTSAAPGGTTH